MTILKRLTLATALLACTTIASPTLAEMTEPGEAVGKDSLFMRYIGSPDFAKILGTTARDWDQRTGFTCDQDYSVQPVNIAVYETVVIGQGDANPSKGEWLMKYQATRCSQTATINVMVEANTGEAAKIDFLVPGETKMIPELIGNLKPVLPRAIGLPDCDAVAILDVKGGAPEGASLEDPSADYETWTVKGCGEAFDLVWVINEADDGNVEVGLADRLAREN